MLLVFVNIGIQINMMPFKFGDKHTLPKEYHGYWHILELIADRSLTGTVCYLTIDEREVQAGESHRRAGLHTESPGAERVGKVGSTPANHEPISFLCY